MLHHTPKEGKTTKAIEKQTSKLPSVFYLIVGLGALASSSYMMFCGKKSKALLIGQWAAPLLIMGLYNKVVKTEGHD